MYSLFILQEIPTEISILPSRQGRFHTRAVIIGGSMRFELTSEQRALAGEVARACAWALRARRRDRPHRAISLGQRDVASRGRLLRHDVPAAYGGQGRSYLDTVLVIEEMAQCCGVTGRIVVEANMGAIGAIMTYGSEAQKRLAADLVLSGDKPAICITEPGAGSAASEMTTRADRRGNGFVVNGPKHWITGGGVSRLHCLRGVFDDRAKSKASAASSRSGIRRTGLRSAARAGDGPARHSRSADPVPGHGDHARPLVIPPRGLRKGFADLMDAYNGQRVGAGDRGARAREGAYDLALDYSQEREQFGRPIAEFQGLQWMMADMAPNSPRRGF